MWVITVDEIHDLDDDAKAHLLIFDRLPEKRIAVDKWSKALASIIASEPADADRGDATQAAAQG